MPKQLTWTRSTSERRQLVTADQQPHRRHHRASRVQGKVLRTGNHPELRVIKEFRWTLCRKNNLVNSGNLKLPWWNLTYPYPNLKYKIQCFPKSIYGPRDGPWKIFAVPDVFNWVHTLTFVLLFAKHFFPSSSTFFFYSPNFFTIMVPYLIVDLSYYSLPHWCLCNDSQPMCCGSLGCRELVPGVPPINTTPWSFNLFDHLGVLQNIYIT